MLAAVIGAQYGDEGKGLLTDFLATADSVVVRYNGGAQAGHTVTTPQGERHVFRHFGSGTFKEAPTLLSRFFLVNPIVWEMEHRELALLGRVPRLMVDASCYVTTPVDMMLNRHAEDGRGEHRHGSCGMGINETVERSSRPAFRLTVGDLQALSPADLLERLGIIRDFWMPRRARELGCAQPTRFLGVSLDEGLEWFVRATQAFLNASTVTADADVIARSSHVLFEGAQGLRLDELSPEYPHVTRSRTGLPNVLKLLHDAGRFGEPMDVHYVTRSYVTRHGAGPLRDELSAHPGTPYALETNVLQPYQGALRYAPLHVDDLRAAVTRDIAVARAAKAAIRPGLVMTCLDQYSDDPMAIAAYVDLPLRYASYGPTREDLVTLLRAVA